MRIQTKTTLLFTAVTATLILLLSITIYILATSYAFNDFHKRLEIRAFIAARALLERDETSVETYESIRKQHLEVLPEEREYFIRIDTLSERALRYQDLPLPLSFFEKAIKHGIANFQKSDVYYTAVHYKDNEGDFIVMIAAKNEAGAKALLFLRKTLILGFVIAVMVVFTIGSIFSMQVYRPVRRLISNVKDISANSLHKRLKMTPGNDEITELGNTFNNMLDRLETSFEVQNNFVSNASHEFRTPLTAIIGEADYILSKERTVETYQESLKVILSEAEKLQHLTSSLLSLAQTGFDDKLIDTTIFPFSELFWEMKNTIDKIYPNNKVVAAFDTESISFKTLRLKGNYQLLKIAITNVVANAYKYSHNNNVLFYAEKSGTQLLLTITDQGIGIPTKEIKYIFEPFFRASNTRQFEGHGIGLPLTNNIVRMHNGVIKVTSNEGRGTIFTICLPLAGSGY